MGITIETDAHGLTRLKFPEPFNAASMLVSRRIVEGQENKPALLTESGNVTYGELARKAGGFGLALLALGLTPKERVLMVLPDLPEFIYLFLGAIQAGIIPIPLSTLLRADDYEFIINDSECAAILYAGDFLETIGAAIARSSWRPRLTLRLDEFADKATESAEALKAYPSKAEDDCFLLYSSGTTGKPKGVVHAHESLPVICHLFAEHMIGKSVNDVFFSMPRLFTSFGLGIGMAIPLWLGAAVVLDPRRPNPQTVAGLIRLFKPSIFAAVPTFYSQLITSGGLNQEDVSSLRFCFSGGEAMPPGLMRRWIALTGVSIREMIGSTEAGFVYIGNRENDIRPGTSGKPIPGYQIRIVDSQGAPQPCETPGRVLIKGQAIMKRYWNNPAKTAETLADGWLDTGDVYFQDKDGYYTYCGRSDDMLKVGGRWISPFEIESTLVEHDKVLEAAVVGRPDEDGLMKVAAWVVLRDAGDMSETTSEEIRAFCKSRLTPYKYPFWVQFVDQLPKTATGKIQRFKLRSLQ